MREDPRNQRAVWRQMMGNASELCLVIPETADCGQQYVKNQYDFLSNPPGPAVTSLQGSNNET